MSRGIRPGFVWLAGIRDLQWRRRRFVIAVFGTSLVFALTLLLSGFLENFGLEVRHTLSAMKADGYVVQAGRRGPFTAPAPLPPLTANAILAAPGVTAANPIVSLLQVIKRDKRPDVYLIGAPIGGLGMVTPKQGRAIQADGEAIVDSRLKLKLNDSFVLGAKTFTVVGRTDGETVIGGIPDVHVTLADAQSAVFQGLPLATSIAVKGTPTVLPPGLIFVDNAVSTRDLRRPLADVTKSIGLFRALLWIVAAAIVGSVIYLSALERVGDFAVFKATGTSNGDLLAALITQAIVLSLSASVLAVGLAYLLAPSFPAKVSFPASLVALLPVVAVIVGILASGAGLRRAVTVDPALAFGGR